MDGNVDRSDETGTAMPVREGILLLLMAFITFGLYYPAMLAPYCFLDDRSLEHDVLNNPSWSYLRMVFGPNEGGIYGGAYFRPFSTMVYFVIAKVFGLEPAAFHLFNVLIHLANGLLIYFIVKQVYSTHSARMWLGFIAATIFLVHPVAVEPVAWISGRATVLSTFLIVVSFSLHLRVERNCGDWRLWAAAFSYLLSLLTYELAFLMPLAFVYWDLDQDPDQNWRKTMRRCYGRWLVYGTVLALYVAYRVARGLAEPGSEDTGGYMVFKILDSFLAHLSSPLVAIGFYLKKVFWPWPLNLYIAEVSEGARPFYLVGGIIFLFALTWWIWTRTWLRFWGVWFLCGLAAVLPLSFETFSWTSVAERYVYLSNVGFAGFSAFFVWRFIAGEGRWLRRTVEVLVFVILFVFATSSTLRATQWQSDEVLLRDAYEQNPTSARIVHSYALVLFNVNKKEEGIKMCQKAMDLGYISGPSRSFGDLERAKKNYAAAEKYYLEALWPFAKVVTLAAPQARPVGELGILFQRDPETYLALIDLHYKMAEEDPAQQKYHQQRIIHFHEAACKLRPKDAHYRYLLAKAHLRFGHTETARKIFAEVSDMAPDTYYGKAAAKLAKGAQVPVQVSPSSALSFDSPGALRLE